VDGDAVRARVWEPQHEWAGARMYDLCITLRCVFSARAAWRR
jgi:hypothetical protein